MNTNEAEHLLNQLRSSRIRPDELTGEQFQAIVFHKLIKRCGGDAGFEYELLDDYHGAVDFVVREISSQSSQFQVENPVHMFECKHYGRPLELSTVAKLLVIGVRFQPTSLNIVSGTRLQPQVYEYARFLFNGLGNDAAMFRRTFFRHFKTDDLLDWKIEIAGSGLIASPPDEFKRERIADVSWEIVEFRPFSQKIIAASNKNIGRAVLDNRWSYRLMASLFTDYHPDQLKIWIDGLPDVARTRPSELEIFNLDGKRHLVRFAQMIVPRALEKSLESHLELHVTYATRSHKVLTVPVAAAPSLDSQTSFPDLRASEARKFSEQLQNKAAPRVLFLGGGAGVGKTHLCESVAANLRLSGEYEINRFSSDSYGETTLLRNMFVTVCTPATARYDSTGGEWQELASSILKALSPMPEIASSGDSEMDSVEILIPAFAELLVRTGPRLVVLRDAHLFSEKAAREIFALISRLDDLGWGDVYLIIEYRTPESKDNAHWQKFESEVRSRVNESVERQLKPLTQPSVYNFLDLVFTDITAELKNSVWKMSDGVPLYLFSIFDVLEREEAIKSLENGRWSIEAPSSFHRLTNTGMRADEVLKKRLKSISWERVKLPKRFQDSPLVFVALLAVAREPARVEKLCELCGVNSEEYSSIRRNLLRHHIIRQDINEWAVDFQHDLLRNIAIETGRDVESAPANVEEILSVFLERRKTASDFELFADLAAWVGFREDAIQALNAAFELVRASENFTLIHRILFSLCQNLEPDAFASTRNYIRYLASRSALAWATWNIGSLTEARDEFSRVAADAVAGVDSVIEQIAAESYAADAERRVLGINLELENVPAFVESAERCVKLKSETVVFNSILNRLILYCARFSHPALGIELSRLALQAFGDSEPESSGAVICSDIGELFRAVSPQDALALYRRGVQLAFGARQRIYNELDVLIAEAVITGRLPQMEELDEWHLRLTDNGLRSMHSRLNLFRASVELRSGRIETAQNLYKHLETSVSVYKHEYFRLAIWNDSMVAALLKEDFKESQRLQQLIVTRIQQLLQDRQPALASIRSLVPAIKSRIERTRSYLIPLDVDIPSLKPAYSGIFPQILLNLENLSEVRGAIDKTTLRKAQEILPTDIDRSQSLKAFSNVSSKTGIDFRSVKLALCAQ